MENHINQQLNININNYSGPLYVLLDLAKSQKVNLEEISISQLADQFLEFINKSRKINLDLASEFLLMATWLLYLKSKLLLPESEEEEFKAKEVATQLKLQLKKLELIRLLSDQLLKKKRIGIDIFFRGKTDGIRSIYSSEYKVTLFDILKSYANHKMTKNFITINIPKLPVFTTEQGIKTLKSYFGKLDDWKYLNELIPAKMKKNKSLKKTSLAGIFSAALELSKEGSLLIKQQKIFDKIFIKQN